MVEQCFEAEYGGVDFSDNGLQEDQMLWIARDAKESGVEYIETSQAVFTKGGKKSEEFINIVNNIMPKIEQATGTKIRFLAAMRRNIENNNISKQEQYKETVENMIKSAKDCPYVVGCDFMGEELNETAHFSEALTNIARYTKKVDPNFVIRVHAGENDSFSKNVSQVLDCIEAVYDKDGKYPPIRIGHGLYGSDENTKEGRKLLER